MPNRIVREAILASVPVASLGWAEEVFYRRLMSIVDDYGRAEAHAQLLRSRCYPLQTDAVKESHIERWLAAVHAAGLVAIYTLDGKRYLEIRKFGQQLRSPSKHPSASDSKCLQMPSNEHLGVSVSVSVSEGVAVCESRQKPPARARKRPLPEGFAISERVRQWAADKGFGRLDERLEHFVGKARAKGYEYVDWDEGFMTAVRDDWAGFNKPAANGARSTTHRAETARAIYGETDGQPAAEPRDITGESRRVG